MTDIDKEIFIRAMSKGDAWLRIFGTCTEAELELVVRNLMNVYIIAEHELERRYPEAYARFEKEIGE